ncbi:hypothetical protein BDF19DRAFT_450556 [Syncephalis fuscata]|nr:hypothetical protein BDF19DRAFT_450556 [Syncephalis fuscata]
MAYPPPGHGPPGGMMPPGAPPGADPQLWSWFQAIDADRSGHLTTDELQRALVNGDWQPFNIETVRLMMNLFDKDNSGTITFHEFAALWKYIEDWKRCFVSFDRDQSGSIDSNELKQALYQFGYNVSDRLIAQTIKKFDRRGRGDVTFDNFIQICVTIRSLTEAFRSFDTDNDGWIQIDYEQFLQLVINNRR